MSAHRTHRVAPMRSTMSVLAALAVLTTACGGDDEEGAPVTLTILAHESFTPSEGIFDEFTAQTGIDVEIAASDDAGTLLSKAALTAGKPEGDVLWGVDNTLLSRAIGDEVFEPYESPVLSSFPADLTALVPGHEVTRSTPASSA